MDIVVVLLLACIITLVVVLIRNEITYKIKTAWVSEVYESQTKGDKSLDWEDIPSYEVVLFNFLLWKYKPLKEYLKK